MLPHKITVYFYFSLSYFLSLILIILLYYSLQLNTFQWVLVRFLQRAFAFRGIFLKGENLPSKATPPMITIYVFQSLIELKIIDT